jgi:peroxiredoxin-like protein
MNKVHTYTITGTWTGDRNSVGLIKTPAFEVQFSAPSNMGGPGEGTNPEELLLGAASGCYLITLSAILTKRKISFTKIDLSSEAFVEEDGGLRVDRIEHRPTIYLDKAADEAQVLTYAEHAEHACMVSSALRGNVEVTVIPNVMVQTTQP